MTNAEQIFKSVFGQTKGFVLNWPIDQQVKVGDYFTLTNNHFNIIGNIYEPYFQLDLNMNFAKYLDIFKIRVPGLEPILEEKSPWQYFFPQASLWQATKGCQANYEDKRFLFQHKRKIEAAEVNKLTVNFNSPGSFFFSASNVYYIRMPHFKEIHKEVIRRLTTEFFNFNKLYLITEVAMASNLSYGFSNDLDAELIFKLDDYYNGSLTEMLSSECEYEVMRTKGLDTIKLRFPGGAIAFKAKKMDLSVKAQDQLIKDLYQTAEKEIKKYAINLMDNDLFHLFPNIEINPGNANEFFQWSDLDVSDLDEILSTNSSIW